jgi:hypothetical protein
MKFRNLKRIKTQEGQMLAVKPASNAPSNNETLLRHRAMYERRLRELARTADLDENQEESLVHPGKKGKNLNEHEDAAVA